MESMNAEIFELLGIKYNSSTLFCCSSLTAGVIKLIARALEIR